MTPTPGVRLTLITRHVDTPYSGMLPGVVAEYYTSADAHIDTRMLCRFAGARLFIDEVVGLDLKSRRVLCRGRPPVPYDVLSIDIGSTPSARDIPGVLDHAIPVKPIDGFLEQFEAARARIVQRGGVSHIVVVGGGPAGVELILAMHARLTRDLRHAGHDPGRLSFTLVTASDTLVPALPVAARQRVAAVLRARGIAAVVDCPVRCVKLGSAHLANGDTLAFDEMFWTTGAAAAPWLADTELALDPDGFIRVADSFESLSHPGVFAVGDIASRASGALPKSGVYAVRAAGVLDDNLRRRVERRPLRSLRPQRHALYLLSTADGRAIGARNGLTVEGQWVWRLKDWIDRRFMDRYKRLPEMEAGAATRPSASTGSDSFGLDDAMRCGGCGAKVGADTLARALSRIEPVPRDDVLIGLGEPDDAAVVDVGAPHLMVHTVDYFRAMIDDPYLFGRIAANHALGDIFAMGGEPRTALAIATLPYGSRGKVEADLSMLMAGANEVLRDAGCALVGGHTSEGAELALGFAVNGAVQPGHVLRKAGLVPGDALIVTKPLGTGVLLAADMRGKAKGTWVMAALATMSQSSARAAAILKSHGVHAASDVTGFGLAGHLLEMLSASKVEAHVSLGSVPLLEGVREICVTGVRSSLQPQNESVADAMQVSAAARDDIAYAVLFDPQTAGGLLASVPSEQADACVEALRAAGYGDAAVIGRVGRPSTDRVRLTIDAGNATAGSLHKPHLAALD